MGLSIWLWLDIKARFWFGLVYIRGGGGLVGGWIYDGSICDWLITTMARRLDPTHSTDNLQP